MDAVLKDLRTQSFPDVRTVVLTDKQTRVNLLIPTLLNTARRIDGFFSRIGKREIR